MEFDGGETPEWEWPTGPGAESVLERQHELAELIAPRCPVFLDVNFWISAREAMTGASKDPVGKALFAILLTGVQSGRLMCPVTSDIMTEFSKQPPGLLAETLALVDLLSLGVALVPHHERVAIEVECLLAEIAWPDHPPVQRPIWMSFAFAFGYVDLPVPGPERGWAPPPDMAKLAWMAPPSALGRALGREVFGATEESRLAADWLNRQEALHAGEIGGMKDARRIELRGAASLIEGIAAREVRRVAAAIGEVAAAQDLEGSRRTGRRIAGMIAQGLEQDRTAQRLGSLHVPAMLHAAMRAHGRRRMKPNDIFDFRHAAAAMPYCKLFLTDGPIRTLLTGGDLRLDALHGCEVISDPAAAIAAVERLLHPLR